MSLQINHFFRAQMYLEKMKILTAEKCFFVCPFLEAETHIN